MVIENYRKVSETKGFDLSFTIHYMYIWWIPLKLYDDRQWNWLGYICEYNTSLFVVKALQWMHVLIQDNFQHWRYNTVCWPIVYSVDVFKKYMYGTQW